MDNIVHHHTPVCCLLMPKSISALSKITHYSFRQSLKLTSSEKKNSKAVKIDTKIINFALSSKPANIF